MGRTRFQRPLSGYAVGIILFAAMAGQPGRAAGPNGTSPGTPEIRLQTVHMIETRAGSTIWEVRADQVEVNEREGVTVLTRAAHPISIVFFSRQGQVTCQADRATLDLRSKDVLLAGAILARSEQGVELRAESLKWIAASRRLKSDDPVTITRGGLVSQGRGMEAETDLERVRILQNITSQIAPAAPRRSRP
jgi:LPS export ABC transporter protein LptC